MAIIPSHPAADTAKLLGILRDLSAFVPAELTEIITSWQPTLIAAVTTGPGGVSFVPPPSYTPATVGEAGWEATTTDLLTLKYKGADGITRSISFPLEV
ncbi:MAG: hypothetical protein ABIR94_21790 [Rubrivivax sp.]